MFNVSSASLRRALRLAAGLCLLGPAAPGCAGSTEPVRAPDPAPVLSRPADAIPVDLDVVLRLDLSRIRQVLGKDAFGRLRQRAGLGAGDDGEAWVGDSLERADTAWLGLRLAERRDLVDSVMVVRGSFRDLDFGKYRARPAWGPALDLGGGWRVYERTPLRRSDAARVYARLDELLVFVTAAEIDGVERVLERGVRDARPTPPERGVISVTARPRAFSAGLAGRAPAAARFLAKSEVLEASADLAADRLKIELAMTMETEEAARRAADAAGLLALELIEQRAIPEPIARSLSIEAVGRSLVVRVDAPLELLAAASS